MTPEEYDAHVAQVVAASPPLTRAQLDRLGMILRPMRLPAAVTTSKLGRPAGSAEQGRHVAPRTRARRCAGSARPGPLPDRAEPFPSQFQGPGGVLVPETMPDTAELPDGPMDRSQYKAFLAQREPAAWFPLVLGSVEQQLQEAASSPTLTAARHAALVGLDATAALTELRAERQAGEAEQIEPDRELSAGESSSGQVAGEEPLW